MEVGSDCRGNLNSISQEFDKIVTDEWDLFIRKNKGRINWLSSGRSNA